MSDVNTVSEIIEMLNCVPVRVGSPKDSAWTKQIKRGLISLGHGKNFSVCAGGFTECEHEWLFDVVWYRNENDHLRDIGLVVECEWSRRSSCVKYDFEKLLIAKSPLKLMIFQNGTYTLADLFALLETGISRFSAANSGEVYLLAGFNNSTQAFEFQSITI